MPPRRRSGLKRRAIGTCAAAFVFLAGLAIPFFATKASENFDPETGYRIAHYRAALPDAVPGGRRVTTEEAEKLFKDGDVLFIDVMPSTGGGYDPQTGRWRLTKSHNNIPGSTWLPDVGRGRLDTALERYFTDNLQRVTDGDKSRALLIYCQSDCWMAWNAVQRAAGLGYRHIYWYPEGIDGWAEWDNPTVQAEPVPVLRTVRSETGQTIDPSSNP